MSSMSHAYGIYNQPTEDINIDTQIRATSLMFHNINNIVVLEDDLQVWKEIRGVLNELNFTSVLFASNCSEVLEYAYSGRAYNFILDVNLGEGRDFEGLEALNLLKGFDKDRGLIFASILSSHDGIIRRQAERIGVDLFLSRSHNIRNDIRKIVQSLLAHNRQKVERTWQSLGITGSIDPPDHSFGHKPTFDEDDLNYQTYLQLMANEEWRTRHAMEFVAIVNGRLEGVNREKDILFHEMNRQFPDDAFFFTQIMLDEGEDIYDIPSILSQGD